MTVSRTQKLGDPLIVFTPRFAFDAATRSLTVSAGGAIQEAGRMLWRVEDLTADGDAATFTLRPGHHTLEFAAIRQLRFRAYSAQRYGDGNGAPLPLSGLGATTNRTFDASGKETNGTGSPTPSPARNALATRIFGGGEISPADNWTFELVPEDLLGAPAGSEQLDLRDLQDVVLSMEYDVTP